MLKMSLSKVKVQYSLLAMMACAVISSASNESVAADQISKAETLRATAAKQNKYTFIMFWKKQDAATKTMWSNMQNSLGEKKERAVYTHARITDQTEANLVKKYGVSRAPMPLALAIAPNGAVTGSFVKKLNQEHVAKSFVSPTKSQCMLALQSRKLVLLNLNPGIVPAAAEGVKEFRKIPCYQNNTEVISLSLRDPQEYSFAKELGVQTDSQITNVVFMAPPGVMIGKYEENVTKEQLVEALRITGNSCGVKGCKDCK